MRLANKTIINRPKDFTNDQWKALEILSNWYNNKELVFTLQGAAGTGKTYLLKYFLNNIVNKSVCLTAPTHKAVRVLEQLTGRKGKTLHSLHGFRLNVDLENFSLNNNIFDPIADSSFGNYNLVIQDECSQINKSLDSINITRAKQFNTKILYVGDPYQLPPVNENISRTFLYPNKIELKELIRQDMDNPLINVLVELRKDIDNNTCNFVKILLNNKCNINSNGEGYEVLNRKEFESRVIELFSSNEFSNDINYARLTSWTNDSISNWNKLIRDKIIKEHSIVDINDLFIGYKTIVDDYLKPKIINSEDYIVNNVQESMSEYGFKFYEVELKSFYNVINNPIVNIVDHTDKSFVKFYNIINRLHTEALKAQASERGRKWRDYYRFKNNYLTLINFNIPNGMVTRELDYGYSITTHKSQGSTYNNVIVDLQNILFDKFGKLIVSSKYYPNATSIRNRLAYVALSRAKTKAIILI